MRTFTDEELEELIACAKRVRNPPRREMRVEGKMKRNDMTLKSADGKHNFDAFMRQSEDFQENFSIGLIYHRAMSRVVFPSFVSMVNTEENVSIRTTLIFISIGAKPTTSMLEFWKLAKSNKRLLMHHSARRLPISAK